MSRVEYNSHLRNNDTHLILTIISGNEQGAIKIIQIDGKKCIPNHVNYYSDTALLLSIHYSMENLAIEILKTGMANVSHVDGHGNTALILAIKKIYY